MKTLTLSFVLTLSFLLSHAQYNGTGSVTQGLGTATTDNLLDCGRVSPVGTIKSTDDEIWTVPAEVNFQDNAFPFASDLHNPCNGNGYADSEAALAALDGSDIVEIDAEGEVITAYIFADNYFEMYVNGVFVGKDKVPFTEFNSSVVRFKVQSPMTISMLLVDWEENLGVGSEDNKGMAYSPGDGGMVAVLKNEQGETIWTTGLDWKAQTFYTAPVKDLSCLSESGTQRLSGDCNTAGSDDGTGYYGIHWPVPEGWETEDFDDSDWPNATTYTNSEIGVDNKSAYTNFTDIFDDSNRDAEFIWSTNVVLDNLVIVRLSLVSINGVEDGLDKKSFEMHPNPVQGIINLVLEESHRERTFEILDHLGREQQIGVIATAQAQINVAHLPKGVYFISILSDEGRMTQRWLKM